VPGPERRPMTASARTTSLLLLGTALLLLPAAAPAAVPVNQCLFTVCSEPEANAGNPCRLDSDCDLEEDDGTGRCDAPAPSEDRIFVARPHSESPGDEVCADIDPQVCCPAIGPEDFGDPCAAATTCTLREAVITANATPNRVVDEEAETPAFIQDQIVICEGIHRLAIPSGAPDDATSGDLDLTDSVVVLPGSLTIPPDPDFGPQEVVIQGGGDRIFHLHPLDPLGEPTSASILGVTIERGGGSGFNESGGGVLNEANLLLRDVILRDHAVGSANGGAIHNSDTGFIFLERVSVLDNRAGGNGGGFSNEGRFTTLNTTFARNEADGSGGGIYNRAFEVASSILLGNTFSFNAAGSRGDAIFNGGNIFTVTNTIVDANGNSDDLATPPANPDSCAMANDASCEVVPSICFGGENDGEECDADPDCCVPEEECPESICRTPTTCAGGANAGLSCTTDQDCEQSGCDDDEECDDGTCEDSLGCLGGFDHGLVCTESSECIGSLLFSGGGNVESPGATCFLECIDGSDAGSPCIDDDDCAGGSCGTPAPFCSGDAVDPSDPPACDVGGDCPGICFKPAGFCDGAPDSPACTTNLECNGICEVDPGTCAGGDNMDASCTSDDDCPGSSCDGAGTDLLCRGGAVDGASCASDPDCEFPCENQRVCFGGTNDGVVCSQDTEDIDCPVTCFTVSECEGGDNIGMLCSSDTECPGSICIVTSGICSGGLDDGESCLMDDECAPLCGNPATCQGGSDSGQACSDDPECGGTCERGPNQSNVAAGRILQPLDETASPIFPLALGALGANEPDRNPAIDVGVGSCDGVDQRRAVRPQDGFFDGGSDCDSGAYEARRPRAEKTWTLVGDDGDGAPEPGETIEYTITLINDEELVEGTDQNPVVFIFEDALAKDELTELIVPSTTAPGLVPPAAITNGNSEGDTFVRVACGELVGNAPETITFRVEISDEDPDATGIIRNQGFVTFPGPGDNDDGCAGVEDGAAFPGGLFTDDPTTFPLEDETRIALANRADLLVCKDDQIELDVLANGEFNPGDTIRYQVVVTNEGQRAARGVLFEDTPHRDTTLMAGSVSVEIDGSDVSEERVVRGNEEEDTDIAIDLGELGERAATTAVIEFVVSINDPIPLGCTDLFNFASLSGDNIELTFSDDPEAAEGESRPAATRTPIVFSPFADDSVRFKVRLDFRKANRDSIRMRMKNVEIPGGIADGDEVILDIGDVADADEFPNLRIAGTLDAKGRFQSSSGGRKDSIRIRQRSRTAVGEDGEDIPVYKLLVKSKKGGFAETFAAFGLENRDAKKEALPVEARVRIGRDCLSSGSACVDFRQNVVLFYNAKAGKKGKGKATVETVPRFDCPIL
jgi:uncharacterized repeat protein (TIGR01451 family)